MKITLRTSLIFIATLLLCSPANAILLQNGNVRFSINAATLQISADTVVLSNPQQAQKVSALHHSFTQATWQWPERSIRISAKVEGSDLRLNFSSDQSQSLKWFGLPPHFNLLQLPIGEGSRIPSIMIFGHLI